MCCVKNVGLSKAVYLLLENTKIDAVAFIIPTLSYKIRGLC